MSKVMTEELKVAKAAALEAKAVSKASSIFNRELLEDVVKRRYFFGPAFEIHGGVTGLFDMGPPGTALKSNMLALWRRHFITEEKMLEIDGPCVTPEVVLKTSGHVDRFTDLMATDVKTGICYRADHLLEDHMKTLLKNDKLSEAERTEYEKIKAQVDAYGEEELHQMIIRFAIKAPATGNDLSRPVPFNLMFGTNIGPKEGGKGYLRPETAQGIFVNFRRLLDYNNGRMPFACATIGQAFRNEIAPRNGLLRVREFTLAEIEHFVNPLETNHPKIKSVHAVVLRLLPRGAQMGDQSLTICSVQDALVNRIITNETLAYYMARTWLFMLKCGIREKHLRFRQHLSNEMAHYAADCWDVEVETSYGWVECVGHADRACFDLKVHQERSKVELTAWEAFDEPRMETVVEVKPQKSVMAKSFKQNTQKILEACSSLSIAEAQTMESELAKNGKTTLHLCNDGGSFEVTRDMINFSIGEKKTSGKSYLPSVIEPSFGIGRILYAVLEHCYYQREEDAQRVVLGFPAVIAPVKCCVLPLSKKDIFTPFVEEVERALLDDGLACMVDDSGAAIGRRYARNDELGVPFGITVDFKTVEDRTVTLCERDSCAQVRVTIVEALECVRACCLGRMTWSEIESKYPKFETISE